MFQVGRLLNPKDDDAKYITKSEADEAAINLSIAVDDDVWAVWDERGFPLTLAYCGDRFVMS